MFVTVGSRILLICLIDCHIYTWEVSYRCIMDGGPAGMALGLLPAHAMSPVGGAEVNLAIQDAVAAANRLTLSLRDDQRKTDDLALVQKCRVWPTKMIQRVQLSSVSEGNSL